MRGMQLLLTGVLIGGFATFGWVNAQSNQGSSELTGGDLAEIHQLYSHYNQGTDFGDANRWLNAFTEDAIFRIGEDREFIGRDQMTEWRRQSFAAREGRVYTYRHWNSSWIITPDGPGPRHREGLLARLRPERPDARDQRHRLLRRHLRQDAGRLADQAAPRAPRPQIRRRRPFAPPGGLTRIRHASWTVGRRPPPHSGQHRARGRPAARAVPHLPRQSSGSAMSAGMPPGPVSPSDK